MADPQSSKFSRPAALLLLLMTRHFLWDKVPYEMQGMVWKITSALCILGLLALVYEHRWWPIFAVFIFEETQVIVCSAWYTADPWPVPPGDSVCSAKAGIDLGAVTVMIVAFLLWRLSTRKVL